jgi:hypothetical protein
MTETSLERLLILPLSHAWRSLGCLDALQGGIVHIQDTVLIAMILIWSLAYLMLYKTCWYT